MKHLICTQSRLLLVILAAAILPACDDINNNPPGPLDAEVDMLDDATDDANSGTTSSDPRFRSSPVLAATQNQPYTYEIVTSDANADDRLVIIAPSKPGWLQLIDHGDGTATLTGTPLIGHIGDNAVVLAVVDNTGRAARQDFTIVVAPQ